MDAADALLWSRQGTQSQANIMNDNIDLQVVTVVPVLVCVDTSVTVDVTVLGSLVIVDVCVTVPVTGSRVTVDVCVTVPVTGSLVIVDVCVTVPVIGCSVSVDVSV